MGSLSRRGFVQGLALAAGLGVAGRRAFALTNPGEPTVLSGSRFDLDIARIAVNRTGRPSSAVAIGGGVPGPTLRWREGDEVTVRVTNRMRESTSIHWHGMIIPNAMDGVPGLTFPGIGPGETFTYRIPVKQSGTYWYHSHTGFQEQKGALGALIVEPREPDPVRTERDYVMILHDWTDEDPGRIISNLKFQSDYYNYSQRTLGTFLADARNSGIGPTVRERLRWGEMRMSPTDVADVSGATYTFTVNGHPPAANWTALFRPGERVRLRLINAAAMTFFDVSIPGLTMKVVAADGRNVEPVDVDQLRIAVAETYDIVVQPQEDRAYTVFAQSLDRSGYARATLATRDGMEAEIPPMDPRPMRTMRDMGMPMMGQGETGASNPDLTRMGGIREMSGGGMAKGGAGAEHGMAMRQPAPDRPAMGPGVQSVAQMPTTRLDRPGDGLDHLMGQRRILTYADLRATRRGDDPREPGREIVHHLTGNMERYIWGFDGVKFTDSDPIRARLGERVRIRLINDTMMEHPIHLHGLWSELENGHGAYRPYKHTISVKPGEELSYLVSCDAPGHWAYHCHLLYHFQNGMFRTFLVA